MKSYTLARYLLREHLLPFVFGIGVITLMFMLNLLFREFNRILSKGLPLTVVAEFFMLNLAWIVALAVPMAVLSATLMAFGRLAANSELTAMQASGISLYQMLRPVVLAALALAGLLVWFNNHVLPNANLRARQLAGDIARKRPTLIIEPGIWQRALPGIGMLMQQVEDSAGVLRARRVLIEDRREPAYQRTLTAQRGEIHFVEASGLVLITLFEGELQELRQNDLGALRRVFFSKHLITIDADSLFLRRTATESRGDREKSAVQMQHECETLAAQSTQLLQQHNAMAIASFMSRGPSQNGQTNSTSRSRSVAPPRDGQTPRRRVSRTPADQARNTSSMLGARTLALQRLLDHQRQNLVGMRRLQDQITSLANNRNMLEVEIHKKYAIPTACLIFVLIGAPLGATTRRKGLATGAGLSIGFFLLYWVFLIAGEDLADRQFVSPVWAMWSANFILGFVGLLLVRRVAAGSLAIKLPELVVRQRRPNILPSTERVELPIPTTPISVSRPERERELALLNEWLVSTRIVAVMLCDSNGRQLLEVHKPAALSDEAKVALPAIVAASLQTATRLISAWGETASEHHVLCEGEKWHVAVRQVASDAILTVIADSEMKMGLLEIFSRRIAAELANGCGSDRTFHSHRNETLQCRAS